MMPGDLSIAMKRQCLKEKGLHCGSEISACAREGEEIDVWQV
jgi:hypothetical protein